MACEITSGYNSFLECDAQGGVASWYVFDRKNLESFIRTDGTITALTLKAGKYAYEFLVEQETSTFTDTATGDRANRAYAREQSATVVLHGNTAEMVEQLDALSRGRTVWIAKLNDGTYEVLFLENGGKVSDARSTGTAFEDLNGNTLTITGKEAKKAPKIDSAVILALLEPES